MHRLRATAEALVEAAGRGEGALAAFLCTHLDAAPALLALYLAGRDGEPIDLHHVQLSAAALGLLCGKKPELVARFVAAALAAIPSEEKSSPAAAARSLGGCS